MIETKVWFITGAGRGMGADFAKAVLAAGHGLVATSRDSGRLANLLGPSANLLAVKLDVTRCTDAEAAVKAAVERFGRIDVLVNNAGTFEAGFFEELTPEQIERQLATNLFGQMHVTRAVLPVMRSQRSGHVITISSTAGLASGAEFTSAYAAAKFAIEGWMEALRVEVAPFGIHTTVVNRRGLQRATCGAPRHVEGDARATGRRPGEAREGAAHHRRAGAAAAALPRGRRRHRDGGAEGRRPAGGH
jgi:NAD(P)-dependent dehydrogenase (short-subunit alcohol dehydrogenase family)